MPSLSGAFIFAAPLLRYRLHWYAVSTARLLLRRWQAVALIVGVVASANSTVFGNVATLTQPLLAVLAPQHGVLWRGAYLVALLAVAALWASMQRAQIEGGDFMAFVGSLPFAPRQRRHVDLAVLLLADSPLLLMTGGALTVAAAHRGGPVQLVLLCDVVLLSLVTQLAALERRALGWVASGVACGVLAATFGTGFSLATALCVGAASVVALVGGPWRRVRPARRAPLRRALSTPRRPVQLLSTLAGHHAPALRIALAVLYRERRDEVIGKALIVAGIAAAAIALVQLFDRDARSFGTLLLAQGAIALSVSGLYRGLLMAHRAAFDYTGALPLARYAWRVFDRVAVLTVALPFLAALALFAWWIAAATTSHIAAAVLSYALLLCALRAPQLFSERHAVVASVIVAGAWIAATIALLT